MSSVWDIPGGIHPPENKHQSTSRSITPAGIPDTLIYPLSQHIGAAAVPKVAVGDLVLKGQMIAEAKGFVSAPVHAATSGRVSAIEDRLIPHASGMTAPCIVIEPDGDDRWIEHAGLEDYSNASAAELLSIIHDAGIAGMGGAGFPSAVKLSTKPETPIHTLIINGTECEPYITSDDLLMRERADEIIRGTEIIGHILQIDQTLIGVEDNKPEGIAALQAAAADNPGISVVSFPTKYPSGGEKQLIQILTGHEVPSGGLPSALGIVCLNLGTTVAVHHAVDRGEPLISRITTVTGNAVADPGNFDVLLGTPVSYLLDLAGFQSTQNDRLVMGGPMMGLALDSPDVPVVKTTNCLLAPDRTELPSASPPQACIRCGLCAEACPASLLPQQLYWYAMAKEYEKLEAHNLFDCIECGACSYVCPSNIPLVQYYRASKADVTRHHLDHEKSERSRVRFESRQQRIEQEEAEKLARKQARREAAQARAREAGAKDQGAVTPAADAADVIQAAIKRTQAKKQAATDLASPSPKAAQERNTSDAAQDAIDKAMAQRAAAAAAPKLSPVEQLEKNLTSVELRITKTQKKLDEARAEESDTAAILESSIAKLETKMDQIQAELAELRQ